MRGIDLCCKAGVGADGYVEAGCEILVGIDIEDQPEYPYEFRRFDALGVLQLIIDGDWVDFTGLDFVHASFPCQAHTRAQHLRDAQGGTSRHEDLLTPGLALLRQLDIPWVCENVPGTQEIMAPQDGEYLTMLCGSMFGLASQRHRYFLTNFPMTAPTPCDHSTFELDPVTLKPRPWGVYHVPGDSIPQGGRTAKNAIHARYVMGVDRSVSWEGLKEGIPPAYTRWIGEQLLALTSMAH